VDVLLFNEVAVLVHCKMQLKSGRSLKWSADSNSKPVCWAYVHWDNNE